MSVANHADWERVVQAVEALARGPERGASAWSKTLESVRAGGLFDRLEIRRSREGDIVVLTLSSRPDSEPPAGEPREAETLDQQAPRAGLDREACAAAVDDLGAPKSLQVTSPPMHQPDAAGGRPSWDRKYSLGHRISGRQVWFGIETTGEVKKLVTIAIHDLRDLPE